MKRNVYLQMMSLDQARDLFLAAFPWSDLAGTETVVSAEALGRVTAGPVAAAYSAPAYQAAAMDGVAVDARQTFGASDESPVQLRVGSEAHLVNTGNPIPPGADAVVMIEQVHQPDPDTVELRAAAFPGQHVRRVGEDVVAGEQLFPRHHRLGAAEVAALLAAGVFTVEVLGAPRVAILPTGSELVDWQDAQRTPPRPGAIIESNSIFLAGLVRECGGVPTVHPRQPDDPDRLRAALEAALASDAHLVILNAGASAGSRDHTAGLLASLGRVLVHGVAAMPGKPSVLGEARGKPVVGTPGYPVSAWVCFDQLVRPALYRMQGQPTPERPTVVAVPSRRLPSRLGQEELVRVQLGRVGDRVVATALKRGAGTITSLTRSDGILRIPAASEGLEEGTPVTAELLRPAAALDDTLVIVGSHDLTVDLLADRLRARPDPVFVSSANVGSLGGLLALAAGHCHLSGTHLCDPGTGEYNAPYVLKHLGGRRCRLVTLARRQQGLMVPRGNPKQILGLEDLTRADVTLVNRQAGSGTRVLLDQALAQRGIDPRRIRGYERDEYTHTSAAVQVRAGAVDVALGILAAARALDLDFVPLLDERYDLCIPVDALADRRVVELLAVLGDPAFGAAVTALGGYDVTPMGELAWEG